MSESRYIDTYAEVKSLSPTGLRPRLRGLALDLLSAVGNEREMHRPRIQFLYLHHTFSDEMAALSQLLDYLADHFTFISHSEAVGRILRDDIDRPYLSISSDDGFRNNLAAGDLLAERGISACFFINPALIGETDHAVITAHCARRLHFPPVEFLSWSEVDTLMAQGHEIGAHTMDHMRISEAPIELIKEDLAQCKALLTEHCGRPGHFAWPYGLFSDFNEAARQAVFEHGFESCSSAERGAHFPGITPSIEQLCLRRDHVILDWPLAHIKYFLRKSAMGSGENGYPYQGS